MEESAILSNIATILTKDILIDNNKSNNPHIMKGPYKFPLLESDDEAFTFFLRQQELLKKSTMAKTTVSPPANTAISRKRTFARNDDDFVTIPNKKCRELNLLNEFNQNEFEGYLHLSKMTFLKIFQSMRHLLIKTNFPAAMTPQTVFSLSLWKLTTDEHFEQIASKFSISLNNCHSIIRHFWIMVSDNYETFIKWPNSPQSQQNTLKGFGLHPQLKVFNQQLFGIICLKQLNVFLESEDEEVSIILQIICNADQKIIDCFVELQQDYDFESSPIGQALALNKQTIPTYSYLIGDGNFPLKSYLIRPFNSSKDKSNFERECCFNRMLEPALALAQSVLDALCFRFNTLYALEAKDLSEVRKIIETICTLHNLCIEIEDDYVERRQEITTFNWAKANYLNILNDTNEAESINRRCELLQTLLPL